MFSLGTIAQQRVSIYIHLAGKVYNANDLTSKDGVIYKALSQTVNTPPHADWDELESGEIYTFNTPISAPANAITISQANTATDGYLSSSDWNIFNNKFPSLNILI